MRGHCFSFWFLVFLGTSAVLYLAAAVVVDPRGLIGLHAFPMATWDSRAEKMILFERYNRANPVEGIILGSSRAMKIPPRELKAGLDQVFFNFAVNNARVEDYLAVYRWTRGFDPHLKTVLIGLDVEALHSDDRFDEQLLNNGVLMEALEKGGTPHSSGIAARALKVTREMLSHGYANDMARSVFAAMRASGETYFLDADGYLHYVQYEKQLAAGTFRLQAHVDEERGKNEARFKGMKSLSMRRRACLERLLSEARRDRVRVGLWITPVHPDLVRSLDSNTPYPQLLAETRTYIGELGERYGIATFDFSEQSLFGGDESGWYDGIHVAPSNASLMTRQIVVGLNNHGL